MAEENEGKEKKVLRYDVAPKDVQALVSEVKRAYHEDLAKSDAGLLVLFRDPPKKSRKGIELGKVSLVPKCLRAELDADFVMVLNEEWWGEAGDAAGSGVPDLSIAGDRQVLCRNESFVALPRGTVEATEADLRAGPEGSVRRHLHSANPIMDQAVGGGIVSAGRAANRVAGEMAEPVVGGQPERLVRGHGDVPGLDEIARVGFRPQVPMHQAGVGQRP